MPAKASAKSLVTRTRYCPQTASIPVFIFNWAMWIVKLVHGLNCEVRILYVICIQWWNIKAETVHIVHTFIQKSMWPNARISSLTLSTVHARFYRETLGHAACSNTCVLVTEFSNHDFSHLFQVFIKLLHCYQWVSFPMYSISSP